MTQEQEQESRRPGNPARRILRGFAFAVLGLALVAAAGSWWLLRTDSGRARLEALVERAASRGGVGLEIEGLGGRLPGEIILGSVKISDAHGVWLQIQDLEVRLNLAALLDKAWHFERIAAASVYLDRLPEAGGKDAEPRRRKRGRKAVFEPPRAVVENLDLRRVIIAEAAFGKAAVVSVVSELKSTGDKYVARTTAQRLDGPPDRLEFNGETPVDFSALDISLTLEESPGGLVGALLSLPEGSGLNVTLAGSGPLSDWSGTLDAQASGTGRIQTEFSVSGAKDLTLKSSGRLESELTVVNDAFWRLIGRQAEFQAEATRTADGNIVMPGFDFKSSGLVLSIEDAALDPETRDVRGRIRGQVVNHQALADLAHMRALQVDDLLLDVSGALDAMDVQLEADVADTAIAGVRAVDSRLAASGVVERLFSGGAPGVRLSGDLESPSIDLPYNQVVLTNVRIGFEASTQAFKTLDVPRLDVSADGAEVKVSAVMALNASSLDADVDAVFDEPGPLLPDLGGVGARGVRLTARMESSPRDVRFDVQGQGVLTGLSGLPDAVAGLAGERVEFAGRAVLADRIVSTPGLDLRGDGAALALTGRLNPWESAFDAAWDLSVEDKEWLREHLGLGLSGKPKVSGNASGTFTDFDVRIKAVTDGVLFGQRRLDDVEVNAAAQGLPHRRSARVGAACLWQGRPVTLEMDVEPRLGGVEFRDVALAAPQVRAGGNMTLLTGSGLARGEFSGRVDRLSEYSDLLGDARGAANIEVSLLEENGGQGLKARLDLFEAGYGLALARRVQADAHVSGLGREPSGAAEVLFTDADLGAAKIHSAQLTAKGGPDAQRVLLSAQGGAFKPFSLDAALETEFHGSALLVTITNIAGEFAGVEARSKSAARLEYGAREVTLKDFALAVGRGELAASMRLTGDEADIQARVQGVDLGVLEPFVEFPVTGVLDAALSAAGPADAPESGITLNITGIKSKKSADATPGRIEFSARLAGGVLDARADLQSGQALRLVLQAQAPANFSIAPWRFHVPGDGELQGEVRGVVDLAALHVFLELEDHYFSGRAPLAARFSGSVDNPLMEGRINLEGVRYEYLPLGAVLRDITGGIAFQGDKVLLEDIQGRDGGQGRFLVDGGAFADKERGFVYELNLKPERAALVHTESLEAVVDGDFRLAGDLRAGLLAGKMTIDPANVTLPERLPPEVVEIEVVKIRPESQGRATAQEQSSAYTLDLDVSVSIPARFFVRGRGLEAEFAGEVAVQGESDELNILGTMSVVRGTYEFLDRRLALEQGALTFTGQGTTPFLDVLAVSRGSEADAKVRLTGPADDFSLELTSDPPLPENEIMARLLFGRRAADLNPLQALQLANALGVLTGRQGSGGMLARARQTLGLDQLQISGGESGSAPAVGVGKYLQENIYLEVERDFTTGGEVVGVEVEITPRIGVSGSASQYSGSEVGVHWKKNY